MATHAGAMAERLPVLYRDGEIVRGLLGVLGVALEVTDEEALHVQRAHWFDTALELDEAAALAAVLGIGPEPWQRLLDYRAWVRALRDARLRDGTVTRRALQGFVDEYTAGFQQARRVLAVTGTEDWRDMPSTEARALVETPPARRAQRLPSAGGAEPLQRFTVTNGGLDPAPAGVLLVGLAEGPEYAPVLANLTNGQALVFLGAVPPGARLWIRAVEGGEGPVLEARLEGDDVSHLLRSVDGLVPGQPWGAEQVVSPAQPLMLERGANDLWFLPVAHYDVRGLDRVLLALADLALEQGRWDESDFDHSLFVQAPALALHLAWIETTPATLRVDLPGGLLRSRAGEAEPAIAAREQLEFALDQGVDRLAAAGVASRVRLRPFASAQRQRDRLTAMLPLRHREVGPTGADRLPDAGGLFSVTGFEDATFR